MPSWTPLSAPASSALNGTSIHTFHHNTIGRINSSSSAAGPSRFSPVVGSLRPVSPNSWNNKYPWTTMVMAPAPAPAPSTSTSTSTSTPTAGPSGPTTAHDPPRDRLPKEAYSLLQRYYHTVSQYPASDEVERLSAQIRAMPGGERCTPERVSKYFFHKRYNMASKAHAGHQHEHHPAPDAPALVPQPQVKAEKGTRQKRNTVGTLGRTTVGILYPSLKDKRARSSVNVLLREVPDPELELAQIWAERIGYGAKGEDIVTYARHLRAAQAQQAHQVRSEPYQQPRSMQSGIMQNQMPQMTLKPFHATSPSLGGPHPPTPETSTSPEPQTQPPSPIFDNVHPKKEEDDEEDELYSDEETEYQPSPVVPSKPPKQEYSYTFPSGEHLRKLADDVHAALSQPTRPREGAQPKTFAEMGEWLKQQAAQDVEPFIQKAVNGTYMHLGIPPHMPS
ncbi:uncharacterized protein BXZ73DRAFT_97998 [Epithele typhae]|uniref:uncharacterized protein n=1 Tax=Epithele typhae TaxID=378194 RepID=UPI002007D1A8|nr:uncharacterized protein BXZ73DRAFT_97998 [Epithele typhae]KAH9941608.1 hypothetical protein BXZ73DRAFT_97998 [Epithele typhae]